uniref:Uncharacterized protein n=1 Tax=Hemiselmis andersenii TaxID=464988 RepID=A0A7S1DWG0_HEMAN|mmetsp:Transcript_27953/g.68188  ORF Transcript_27953/g.68188 Transcript_27953/m.68188 type:complete len:169 (+) Transcript_27953:487-993(+)
MIKKFTLHPFLVSFFLKKKKKMFFLKVAIFINLFNKNELVLYSSNFKETFDFDIKKKEGYKILKIFKIGKKIFFYNAFPIVSYKPISKKTKPIDCFYEVKFAIKIKKKKGKWLIGKLNRKKNLINIFPIAKTLDKVFPNNLKKKFLKFSPFCSNFPNFFDNKKNNWFL